MKRLTCSIAALFLGVATGLVAQGPRGGGRGPAAGETVEKIRELSPALYMISGGGGRRVGGVTAAGWGVGVSR